MGVGLAVVWFLLNYFGLSPKGFEGHLIPSLLWSLLPGGLFVVLPLGKDARFRRAGRRE